jgi:hypothetical protein
MEVDGMMAEAGAEVAPEAGAPEAGAEVAPEAGASEAGADASEPPSEPPSEPLADEQYEAGADVMDDVDEVEEGKVQHVHGAAHEPQLHGVHAQVPPRRRQVAVQDDGRSRDNGDRIRDYPLPLGVIHGLVTVSKPGPVQNTFSTEKLQMQDYWDRIIGTETTVYKVRNYVLYKHSSSNPTMAAPRS